MDRHRAACVLCFGWVAVLVLSTPAAAQSVGRQLFDDLNVQLLYVALPLALLVEVILVTAVVRFRDNDDPKPTASDPTLEITWTAATAVILVFAGFSAYVVLGSPYISATADAGPAVEGTPDEATTVEVVAYQWSWQMHYPEADVTTRALLVVPNGTDVYLRISSEDVVHSLFVPAFGLKQDAFPGQETTALARPTATGTHRLYCTEFCGEGHSRMDGTVHVVSPERYRTWLDAHRGQTNVTEPPA
ncbi:cytochrome c oxidase subunit II [Halosimplex salinum]|uniref:cytochrome c oxidase subunit II n=1 Tax=Halosimplex salinum TaxID=1710538 RepID=UPI000F464F1B|nr:cytochrome c oxidase subunit II [Halosimplex salinum]